MILITGATGLLGSQLVRRFADAGLPVIAFHRQGSDTTCLREYQSRITWRTGDVTDATSIQEAMEGVTGVVHAAAYVSFNPREAKKVEEINVVGTRVMVNAALRCGVKRFVHISSVAALGRTKDQTRITEENKWAENTINSTYAKSKYKAELEVFRGQQEGLSTVMVNPSVILGTSDWNKSSSKIFNYVWKQRPFYTDGFINYVDARDIAEVVFQLYTTGIEGERFILNAGHMAYHPFLSAIATRMNRKAPSLKLSKTGLRVLAWLENIRAHATGAEPLITRETARFAGTEFYYDTGKLRNALKFSFRPLDDTLDWCCAHYTSVAEKN
jgi:nucleoside-diphosphate-sugar epimerase